MRDRNRHPRSRCQPFVVGLERQTDFVVENPQIAVPATHHRCRHDGLHLLRHHADIEFLAAVVGEAIEAEAVVEFAQQGDVVLEPNIGPSSASTTPMAATAASSTATGAADRGGTGVSTASASACSSTTAAIATASCGEALSASIGINARPVGGTGVAKRIARGPRAGGGPISACGAIVSARQISRLEIASARLCSGAAAEVGPVAAGACARLQDLLAAPAAEIHPGLRSAADVAIATEFLRDVRVRVAHALTMNRIVRPVVVAGVDVVDVD